MLGLATLYVTYILFGPGLWDAPLRAFFSILSEVLSGTACCFKACCAVLLLTSGLPTGVAHWEVLFPS